jgi:hypothetical protein
MERVLHEEIKAKHTIYDWESKLEFLGYVCVSFDEQKRRAGGVAQVVQGLCSKRETLSSNAVPPKKKKKENGS